MRVESTRLFLRDDTPRPVGSLLLAGSISGSLGTGHKRMRVLGCYALVYLVAGSGLYRDALGTRQPVKPGDCILVFPELAHAYGPGKGEFWDEIYLCFHGAMFETWRHEKLIDPSRPLFHAEPVDAWHARLQNLALESRPTTPTENLAQLGRLTELLAQLVACPPAPGAAPLWLTQARHALESNLGEPAGLEAVARDAGMSYESFRKVFTKELGISPNRYRTDARIAAAKILLERGELTLAAVASSLGFRDEFHFSKRFKAVTGLSPREFRRQFTT